MRPRRARRSGTDRKLAAAWKHAVCGGARCAVCGAGGKLDGHHVISQQALRGFFVDLGFDHETAERWRWDPRNGIALCERCHSRHELAVRRVPLYLLPHAVFAFVAELDALFGDRQPVHARLRRQYPEM
ncbi:MAG: HNH endonuclease [Baekduia sp.]